MKLNKINYAAPEVTEENRQSCFLVLLVTCIQNRCKVRGEHYGFIGRSYCDERVGCQHEAVAGSECDLGVSRAAADPD